ncbi:MAG TPA: hypothetical protein VND41_04345 [Nitrososphaerales archaeon]|nr:hypothetical protein [Nitrososphaerales archaeon]
MSRRDDVPYQGSAREPETLRLITTGRTTGLPHAVIVRFVFYEGAYFVIGEGDRSDWYVNALVRKEGKVMLAGHPEAVACEAFSDIGLVRRLFEGKYGPGVVKEWYSKSQVRSLRLTPAPPPPTLGETALLTHHEAALSQTSKKWSPSRFQG